MTETPRALWPPCPPGMHLTGPFCTRCHYWYVDGKWQPEEPAMFSPSPPAPLDLDHVMSRFSDPEVPVARVAADVPALVYELTHLRSLRDNVVELSTETKPVTPDRLRKALEEGP